MKVILLIEDNQDDEVLTVHALERANLPAEIVVVRDGQEALDYLFCSGGYAGREASLPTVALLDLNLPKVGGLDVLRQVRADERTKHLPVVVLTSSVEDEDRLKSYDRGANAYVRKPVDFARFSEAAKTLGLFWVVLNEAAPGAVK